MEFQTVEFSFPSQSGTQYRSARHRFAFHRKVVKAAVCLTGYTINMQAQREVKDIVVRLDHEIINNATPGDPEIAVTATVGLQDGSGYFNDPFSGEVRGLLMFELEPGGREGLPDIHPDIKEILRDEIL